MKTISVSKINDFNSLMSDKPFMSVEKFNNSIKGIKDYSFEASRGTAVHELIEKPFANYFKRIYKTVPVMIKGKTVFEQIMSENYVVKVDGQEFTFDLQKDALLLNCISSIKNEFKGIINEVPASFIIETSKGPLMINMRLDGIFGNQIVEYKTCKSFKYETYKDSLQWQLYLMATSAELLKYRVIELSHEPKLHSFQFNQYDIDKPHIIYVVEQLLNYLEINNLTSFIEK